MVTGRGTSTISASDAIGLRPASGFFFPLMYATALPAMVIIVSTIDTPMAMYSAAMPAAAQVLDPVVIKTTIRHSISTTSMIALCLV